MQRTSDEVAVSTSTRAQPPARPGADAVSRRLRRGGKALACAAMLAAPLAAPAAPRLAVTWFDAASGRGQVRLLSATAPWPFLTEPLEVGRNANLRYAEGWLFALSGTQSTLTVVSTEPWAVLRTLAIPGGAQPQDIAVVSRRRAYLTRAFATPLLRLDPSTGATQEVLDLAQFEHTTGELQVGMLELHEGRLFVQLAVYPSVAATPFDPESYLVVVDVDSETLVDVDPARAGVQAIRLVGTPPRHKMQIYSETRRLFVTAAGAFFDEGGLEMVDLDALTSLGLVVAEADGNVAADLGTAVLVRPDRGYLVFSTDLLPSSHLHDFTLAEGAIPIPEYYTVVDYRVPTLLHELETDSFFMPEGGFLADGVRVFDARNGEQLSHDILPTSGPPSDIALLCDTRGSCGCTSQACPAVPALPLPALFGLSVLLVVAAAGAQRRMRRGAGG